MISFHNIVARYMFSLGREGVLPNAFGRTARHTGAPRNGSLAQSALGLTVILVYALALWDPLVQLFYWGATAGCTGVMLLITLTSIAVIGYFTGHRADEGIWQRTGAPVISSVLLLVVSYLALTNLATLFGLGTGSNSTWVVPTAFALAALAGVIWAMVLRSVRPQAYDAIGLGADTPASSPRQPSAAPADAFDNQP